MFVTEPFVAYLAKTLEASDVYLPLASSAHADLVKLLKDGDYTYLTIQDDTNIESVKVYSEGGVLLLDRAQCSTDAHKFSYGAQVCTVAPTHLCAIRSFVEELTATCYNPDAMGTNLSIVSRDMPAATVGTSYRGQIIMGGRLPIIVSVTGAPTWMTVTHYANMIELTGTPTLAGSHTITVKANNTFGESISNSYTLTVN